MNTYGVIGGTLWGNRGAEAMVVTTIGRVRERDPDARFVIFSYYPQRDRELVRDPAVSVVDATPRGVVLAWLGALLCRTLRLVGLRPPDALLPAATRALRACRALFDVSGISFYDGRLPVVAYNVLCTWPAFLVRVPVIRLAQAMGPFRHPVNRLAARWVIRRALHTFTRGRVTAEFLAGLGAPEGSWSPAADVAFAYRPEFRLTAENEPLVVAVRKELRQRLAAGSAVVGLVPSSLVNRKLARSGGDYVGLLRGLVVALHERGVHVLVMPNATRAGVAAVRNNDLSVIAQLRARIAAAPEGIQPARLTFVDFDLDTASIRSITDLCTLLVTSRFHAMVAALAHGVPPLVMGWSHKYAEVLEQFGCEGDAVDIADATTKLLPMVERLLADHELTRERILKALPEVTTAAVAQFDQLDRLPPPSR